VVNRLSLYWDTKFKKKTDEYVKTVKLLHVDVVNKLATELATVNASRRFSNLHPYNHKDTEQNKSFSPELDHVMGSVQFGGSDGDGGSDDSSKSSLKSFEEELLSADRTSTEPAITVPTHECQVQNLGMYPHSSTFFAVYINELTLFSFL
jgi:hypothetical protein